MRKLLITLFILLGVSFPLLQEIDAYKDHPSELLVLECTTIDSLDSLDCTESFKRDPSLRQLC